LKVDDTKLWQYIVGVLAWAKWIELLAFCRTQPAEYNPRKNIYLFLLAAIIINELDELEYLS